MYGIFCAQLEFFCDIYVIFSCIIALSFDNSIRCLKTTNAPTDNDVMPLKIPHIGKTQRMIFIRFAASTVKYKFNSLRKILNWLIEGIPN